MKSNAKVTKSKTLDIGEIVKISKETHNRFFKHNNIVPVFDEQMIYSRLFNDESLPIIIKHDGKQMWIDRQYIAISKDKKVDYLYVTKEFCKEEIASAKDTIERNKDIDTVRAKKIVKWAKDTIFEFALYFKVINMTGRNYLIHNQIKRFKNMIA